MLEGRGAIIILVLKKKKKAEKRKAPGDFLWLQRVRRDEEILGRES